MRLQTIALHSSSNIMFRRGLLGFVNIGETGTIMRSNLEEWVVSHQFSPSYWGFERFEIT